MFDTTPLPPTNEDEGEENKPLVTPLRLYLYTGLKSGLMVVGSQESLRTLARELEAASHSEGVAYSEEWPHRVLDVSVESPYSNVSAFGLSFHVEGSKPSQQVVPLLRQVPGTKLQLAICLFAVFGLYTLVKWLCTAFG